MLTDLQKKPGRFLRKFAVEFILNIPPHPANVATLPCETLISAKQILNDKLQGNWEKFHLVELNVLIKFHQNNHKVIYFWRFDFYQRPSSEEAGTRSSSGSWCDKLESSQEPEEDLVPASSDERLW